MEIKSDVDSSIISYATQFGSTLIYLLIFENNSWRNLIFGGKRFSLVLYQLMHGLPLKTRLHFVDDSGRNIIRKSKCKYT